MIQYNGNGGGYPRKKAKVFAENAEANRVSVFGSKLNDGTSEFSKDLDDLQSEYYEAGWQQAVITDKNYPLLSDMNGALLTLSQQVAYILQHGVAEYNAETTYYTYDKVSINGVIYTALQDEFAGKNPLTETSYWAVYYNPDNNNYVPVGTIYSCLCSKDWTPDNSLPCNGAEYSRSQFSNLWTDYLTSNPVKLATCTYTEYQNDLDTYGQCAKFAVDTVNNKFRVPLIKDGSYIGNALNNSEIGKSYKERLPNIYGTFGFESAIDGETGTPTIDGAFYTVNSARRHLSGETGGTNKDVKMSASRCSSAYQDGAKVQGDHVRIRYFVVISTGTINQSEMDWAEWSTGLNSKVDKTSLVQLDGSLSLPSDKVVSLALGASGTTYTAPANGWVFIQKVPTAIGQTLYLWNVTKSYGESLMSSTSADDYYRLFLPVNKDEIFEVTYSMTGEGLLKFYYAKGDN